MTTRIDLPGNHWAELREPEELTVRQRRIIERVMVQMSSLMVKVQARTASTNGNAPNPDEPMTVEGLDLTEHEADLTFAMQNAAIVAYLDSWSYPGDLPTMETVEDIPRETYDALSQAVSKRGAAAAARPDFVDASVDEPGNPTGSSNGSDGSSTEGSPPTPLSIPTSSSSTENSATEAPVQP